MNVVANGFIIVNSYRVLSVVSVNIMAHAIVYSEVKVSICAAFCAILLAILDLTMYSCMNGYETYCTQTRDNKRLKYISFFYYIIKVYYTHTHINTCIYKASNNAPCQTQQYLTQQRLTQQNRRNFYYTYIVRLLRSKGIDMCRVLRYFTRDTGLNLSLIHI